MAKNYFLNNADIPATNKNSAPNTPNFDDPTTRKIAATTNMTPQISVFSLTYALATILIIEAKKANTTTKGVLNRVKFSINKINEPENKLSKVPIIPNISSNVLEVLLTRFI